MIRHNRRPAARCALGPARPPPDPWGAVLPRRLLVLVLIPLVLLAVGTVGYRALEGPNWSFLDALYMTAITLTTVGFGEVHPLSPAGKVFTIVLCLGGISAITYAVTEFLRVIL